MATQFLDQLDELTLASMFGNVGTTIAFQVSQHDAEILANELGGGLLPADLLTLPKFQAYVRLLAGGVPSTPFSVRTLPPAKRRGDEQSPTRFVGRPTIATRSRSDKLTGTWPRPWHEDWFPALTAY